MATAQMVAHGRRKGSSLPGTSELGVEKQLRPSEVAVLPAKEWMRIKTKCSSWQNPAPSRAVEMQKRREELHQQSVSIVKNWENTIEGQRLKRLQARRFREEEEERKRSEIDAEEAKYQAEQRKKAIERARTLLYYQTDRVKQLNSALVLSEVIRERDAQLLHKKRRQDFMKTHGDLFLKLQEKEREMAIIKDMEAAEDRSKKRADLAKFHIEQKEQKKKKKLEERLGALEEQKKLDNEAFEHQLLRKKQDKEHFEKKEEHRRELDMVLEDKKKAAMLELQQAQIDEEKMKIYIKTKKHMEKLRKGREAEIRKEFQLHQQAMRDNLQKHMDVASSDEDQRIAQAMKRNIAKRDAEQHEKQMEYMAAARDIHYHMLEQIAESEQKKKEHKELDNEMLKQRIIQDQKFHNQQLEKLRKANQEVVDLKEFQQSQMSEMKARKQAEKDDLYSCDEKDQTMMKLEETQFQQYANKTIHEAKARGGLLQPLIKAAMEGAGGGHGPVLPCTNIRPSYHTADTTAVELPSYTVGKLVKKKPQPNTQKRLGFIW